VSRSESPFSSAPLKILHCARVIGRLCRTRTMRWMAWFARRSPPQEAVTHVQPEEPGSACSQHHRAANCALPLIRSRVVADGCEQRRGDDWSLFPLASRGGAGFQLSDQRVELQIESDDVVTQILVSARRLSDCPQRCAQGRCRHWSRCLSDDGDQFFRGCRRWSPRTALSEAMSNA
jgi:hypothetical protein